ncbi:uncharacterized protein LOC143891128 [Tasmannia lanceolata]|uniref:uncharacterized protein LOC143891128 n=1 Tax=Tasmannia lanceolata TaxID=3420 RepID=UPI004062855E
MSKSAERCLPFFKTLRNVKDFQRTGECQTAFDQLKAYLQTPLLLSKPVPGEDLYLYLAVGPAAMSFAIPITVLTDQPLQKILQKPDTSGRLINWTVELGEFDIQIKPRPAIKSQVLADFIAERTIPMNEPEGPINPNEEPALNLPTQDPLWMLYVDGSSNAGGSSNVGGSASNNEAEFEALIAGIALATKLRANRVRAHSDSQLVVGQVNGFSEAKEERMLKYLEKVRKEISAFEEFQIVQIPRTMNARADALSKMASSRTFEPGNVYTEILSRPSIEKEEILQLDEEPSCMDLIVQYMKEGTLPSDRKEAVHYIFDRQALYKRSFHGRY